jgi:hypothetical protein
MIAPTNGAAAAPAYPVGGDIESIVAEWIGELAAQGFEPDDPVFPATKVAPGANRRFAAVGLEAFKEPLRRLARQGMEHIFGPAPETPGLLLSELRERLHEDQAEAFAPRLIHLRTNQTLGWNDPRPGGRTGTSTRSSTASDGYFAPSRRLMRPA